MGGENELRPWKNIEHMVATFREAVNIGHIATFRGQIPHMLGQHLGVRPMVPPETLDERGRDPLTPQKPSKRRGKRGFHRMARETVSAG